jgi:CheY-like chemotaxis protein
VTRAAAVQDFLPNPSHRLRVRPAGGIGFAFYAPEPTIGGARMETTTFERQPTESPTLNILVVDDEEMLRELIGSVLAIGGHTIVTAVNGRDALDKFLAGTFDLVFTDRAMPEMNGDEMARTIKNLSPQTPIIMVTAYGFAMNGQALKPEGVDRVVNKPFRANELLEAVAELRE